MSAEQLETVVEEHERGPVSTEKPKETPKPEEPAHYQFKDVNNPTPTPQLKYEKIFYFEWRDPETGEVLSGTFHCRRPTLGDVTKITSLKLSLCEGNYLGAQIDALNEAIAYTEILLKEKPEWWKPKEFYDEEPLRLVYQHIRKWQDSFRDPNKRK